jgi:hypothetical protein
MAGGTKFSPAILVVKVKHYMKRKLLKPFFTTIICGALIGEGTRNIFCYIDFGVVAFKDQFNFELLLDFFGGVLLGLILYEIAQRFFFFDLRLPFVTSAWVSYTLTVIFIVIKNPTIPNEFRYLSVFFWISTFGVLIGYNWAYFKLNN